MTSERRGSALRPVIRIEQGLLSTAEDHLAEEVPVAMHFNGQPYAVMMATPDDLEDFAHGFALTERGIARVDNVHVSETLEGIFVDVQSDAPPPMVTREMPGRSGCGICGHRELEDVVRHPVQVTGGGPVTPIMIERALEELRARQPINGVTGSVHAAAWADRHGEIRRVREDVGRHNALDKLIGSLRRDKVDLTSGFALITSRASYEMVTKAAVAGITILAAISAPTALAVHLARSCELTLLGFVRPGRFVVYSDKGRVTL